MAQLMPVLVRSLPHGVPVHRIVLVGGPYQAGWETSILGGNWPKPMLILGYPGQDPVTLTYRGPRLDGAWIYAMEGRSPARLRGVGL